MDEKYERFLLELKLRTSGRLAREVPTPAYHVVGEGLVVPWPCASEEEWLERFGRGRMPADEAGQGQL
jgi:hypothetical protein